MRRSQLEGFAPQIRPLSDNPALKIEHDTWIKARGEFNAELQRENSPARDEGWQRSYFRGSGEKAPNTRLRLKVFER